MLKLETVFLSNESLFSRSYEKLNKILRKTILKFTSYPFLLQELTDLCPTRYKLSHRLQEAALSMSPFSSVSSRDEPVLCC